METLITFLDKYYAIVVALIVLATILWRFLPGGLFKKPFVDNTEIPGESLTPAEGAVSLLLAYYSKGQQLNNMSSGKIGDMRYMLLMTSPMQSSDGANTNKLIFTLYLPFNTQGHIIGIGNNGGLASRALIENYLLEHGMEKVELEGDFVNYFMLYAALGQQQQLRYIFDPKVMEYVVDYCKSNYWEIVGDEMYFIVDDDSKQDGESIVEISQKFVEYIEPNLIANLPSGQQAEHEAPYGQYWGKPFKCPICSAEMTADQDWYQQCPEGHGILISGRYLVKLRDGEVNVKLAKTVDLSSLRINLINCPKCGNIMQRVNYQESGTIIDVCQNCTLRWLDANELAKVINPKV